MQNLRGVRGGPAERWADGSNRGGMLLDMPLRLRHLLPIVAVSACIASAASCPVDGFRFAPTFAQYIDRPAVPLDPVLKPMRVG